MLKLFVCLLISLSFQSTLASQKTRRAEFDAKIDDWFIFDLDDDGEREIMAFFPLNESGRPYALATRVGDQYVIEKGIMDRRVVSMALGEFGMGPGLQIALIQPDQVTFMGKNKDGKLTAVGKSIPFRAIIRSPLAAAPGFWHWNTDIDGDGKDDLYLPGDEGLVVLFGDGKGGFHQRLDVPMAGSRQVDPYSSGHLDFERSYPSPSFLDVDGDKLVDICWFDEKGLSFVPQGPVRTFDISKKSSFNLEWLSGGDSGGVLEKTEIELKDVNQDQLPDLFLSKMSTPASGITKMSTTLVILLNQGKGKFAKRPDFALRIGGIIGNGPQLTDLNADGRPDLVFGSYGTSVSDAIQRAMGNIKVSFNVYIAKKDDKNPFLAQPDLTANYRVPKSDYAKWSVRNNYILHEDLNGDGIADLFQMVPTKGGHILSVSAGRKDRGKPLVFDDKPFISAIEGDIKNVTFRTMTTNKPVCMVIIKDRSLVTITLD
ncbi:MAG: hypothetical protein ACI97A_003088 [Planctomycetota bacterium]|jgi:hypothetical protein